MYDCGGLVAAEQLDFITKGKLDKLEANWPQWRFRCDQWEKDFIDDCLARYSRYGESVVMSVKQRNNISRILAEIET